MTPLHDRPLASPRLTSYRYRGRYGWIMIGALGPAEALRQAQRSFSDPHAQPQAENLEIWDGTRYTKVTP